MTDNNENSETAYRPELPPVPERMRSLPIRRGYPVPWFVAIVDGDYHFPTADGRKLAMALKKKLCWCCGQKLGTHLAFVLGPMCAINRITSEPPNHLDCATFAATACPFMVRPHMKRVKEMPEGAVSPPGEHLERNPGATGVWVTKEFFVRPVGDGVLFRIGDPVKVYWFAKGRLATREEVQASVDGGLPTLQAIADAEGPAASAQLHRMHQAAMELMPT